MNNLTYNELKKRAHKLKTYQIESDWADDLVNLLDLILYLHGDYDYYCIPGIEKTHGLGLKKSYFKGTDWLLKKFNERCELVPDDDEGNYRISGWLPNILRDEINKTVNRYKEQDEKIVNKIKKRTKFVKESPDTKNHDKNNEEVL